MNENHTLTEQQVLAAMRHIVAPIALSPTNAAHWGLERLYDKSPNRHELLTCRLMAELLKLCDEIRPANCFSSPEYPCSSAGDWSAPQS